MNIPAPQVAAMHEVLLRWFAIHREDFPWRHNSNPYTIWVSEIMLQQTQVATVIPYFERFIARLPSLVALAQASIDDVLQQWQGLGYYTRARNLHRAAQIIVREHGGELPRTVTELRKLPGIGRYTAGAIASFAFGQDEPVLDGNIIRVLSRVFDIEDDISTTATRNGLWELAGQLVPPGRAAPWNEALMELGRRVCVPGNPRCDACPISPHCAALRRSVQHERPVKRPKPRLPYYDVTAAVIRRDDGRLLIAQRPLDGMLGGLWEFPGGKRESGETLEECLKREIREELAIEIEVNKQIGVVKHAYSHFRISLYAFDCRHVAGSPATIGVADFAWVRLEELGRYAFPTTDQKIIAILQDGSGQPGMDFR